MCDKMAISAYILKIVEKYPFLRLQMRAKEDFNRHQRFLSCNKRYMNSVVFLDIKKAFDTVDHQILIEKRKCYRIHDEELKFF